MQRHLGRAAALAAGAVALLAAGAFVWVDRRFEEPAARKVPSLAAELGAARVLAIFAHPDDEQLAAGLLTRAKRDDGAWTGMITATRGEAGTQMPEVVRQPYLGIVRTAEVLKNGYALDLDAQEVWELPDGGLEALALTGLVRQIVNAFHRYEPDLVVTFWPQSGATRHPDHMRIGLAAQIAAYEFRGIHVYDGPSHVAYVLMPRDVMRRFGGERGQFVAENQPAPTHAMPGETPAKLRGWDIHESQGEFVERVYGVPANVLYTFFDKEFYYVEEVE